MHRHVLHEYARGRAILLRQSMCGRITVHGQHHLTSRREGRWRCHRRRQLHQPGAAVLSLRPAPPTFLVPRPSFLVPDTDRFRGAFATAFFACAQSWVSDVTEECGSDFSGGYCDCCPDCYSCVHGGEDDFPHPALPESESQSESRSESESQLNDEYSASSLWGRMAKQSEPVVQRRRLFDNAFCDCRSGLDVSPDYSPCWNSCLDCLGDDGIIAYMPGDVAEACVGKVGMSVAALPLPHVLPSS